MVVRDTKHTHTHNSGKSGTGGKMRKDAECFPRKTDKRVKVRAKSKPAYWEKEEVGNVSQRSWEAGWEALPSYPSCG